jgi:hypothetical protein
MPLAVHRTFMIEMLKPVLRPLPAVMRRCRIRRTTLGR